MALAHGREDEAWSCARSLLEPTQQQLPDPLNAALAAALAAKAADQCPEARAQLDRAVAIAGEMGYL